MTKVFITGENGSIGLAVKEVIENFPNHEVVSLDTPDVFFNTYHYAMDGETIIKAGEPDITSERNCDLLIDLFQEAWARDLNNDCVIVNTAAYVGTDKCDITPYGCINSNIYGTQLMIDVCKATGAFLIQFSTTASMDPDDYMKNDGYFDETGKIDPRTTYGLTKYLAEKAVQQSLPPEQYVILKPLFLYGDAPSDNASMLRKMIEHMMRGEIIGEELPAKYPVLLDREMSKPYMRIEFFQRMFAKLYNPDLRDSIAGKTFILARDRADKFGEFCDIIEDFTGKKIDDHIDLQPEKDYLADHRGLNTNFMKLFPDFVFPNEVYDNRAGLMKQFDSVVRYLEQFKS